jgi:hypothetical protein
MKKRPGPGDLTSQLGSFLRSTWKQLDPVKDFVVQKSGEAKRELDLALVRRKRKQAMVELGEAVMKLVESGKIDEEEFPELSSALATISAIDEQLGGAPEPAGSARAREDEEDFLDEGEEEAEIVDEKK